MTKKIRKIQPKKILKVFLFIFLVYFLYFVLGVTLPFIHMRDVSDSYKENFSRDKFYSDSVGVDRAMVVEDSLDALTIRLNMINEAKESIILSTFSMKQDKVCEEIFSAVYAAAERGVKVQIFGDGLSCTKDTAKNPMYYALGSHPNIEIRFYNNLDLLRPWTLNGRMHDKYIIIDDHLLLLGGRNTSSYFLGNSNTGNLSYDRDILVYNTASGTPRSGESVIKETTDYFYSVWNLDYNDVEFESTPFYKKGRMKDALTMYTQTYERMKQEQPELFQPLDYYSMTVPTNKITLLTNPTHIMSKEPYILYELCELMENAKNRVWIQSPYFVLNDDMYQAFGVINDKVNDFRLLLNSTAVGDNFMASSDYTFNRDKVIDIGADIYEFQGTMSTHNKSLVIDDDIAVIGSYNFDMRSVYLDTEVMLVVNGTEFTEQLSQCILKMQNELALPVLADGSYGENGAVQPTEKPLLYRIAYPVTSVIFQLFRFLL